MSTNRFLVHIAATAGLIAAAIVPASAGSRVPPPPIATSPDLPDGWGYNSFQRSRAVAQTSSRQPIWRDRGLFSSSRAQPEADPYRRWDQPAAPRRSSAHPPSTRRAYAPPARQRQKASRARREFDPAFLPTVVDYDGPEAPGTIIIDTPSRYLYLVEANGTARRYGVGVGRPGFAWAGEHKVTRKAEWPEWRPPAEMRQRQPGLPTFMPGGPRNPLGARALYLGSTLYRIHGSNEPWTIGHAVSSGCIRMRNEDVKDLYARVDVGTKVVVN
ncbi:L,D-transpeptidase-like protein [Breoghania corrubedonensis]|uniref:L,D-transpeptidase-like protein n=1 Tax=Breoghania corrubedonensis TaxID=665038 RepID=A0A2T5VF30_9HYPH|nr:L,D-transpeptidase [Breoghania corrubedonensis]PTW62346.1 L,D-transpeptidase-like protein [Breoghania corrubedonensis]